jgi:hypothetical protein
VNAPSAASDESWQRARAEIAKEAGNRRGFYADSELDSAADLLSDLYATGERHGVERSRWGYVTSLAAACVDVSRRDHFPQSQDQAAALLDVVQETLNAEHGITAHRDGPHILLPRVDATPAWSGRSLAVSLQPDFGWCVLLPGLAHSPVLPVDAPLTDAGAREIAAMLVEINTGHRGNPFSE